MAELPVESLRRIRRRLVHDHHHYFGGRQFVAAEYHAGHARASFVNNDTRSHNMTLDPHPEHNDCPEINTVGLLLPNQSRETANMMTIRTCGFHDHDDPPPRRGQVRGEDYDPITDNR